MEQMKIYFDNCCLQRPLDDKSQLRISLESEIILSVLNLFNDKKIKLISSDILLFEIRKSTNVLRKEYCLEILDKCTDFIALNKNIENKAQKFIEAKIKPLDALHLASSEVAKADFFCTVDDYFLKKAKALKKLNVKVVSLFELIQELEK